jgi:hypothetical protein
MPKRLTIENTYPTLRKPLGSRKETKNITLRERTNLPSIPDTIPLENFMTSDSDFIGLPSKYVYSYNVKRTTHNNNINIQNISNRMDAIEYIEDNTNFIDNNTLLDDFSFSSLRPNSPTTFLTNRDLSNNDNNVDENNSNDDDCRTDDTQDDCRTDDTQITTDKKYYDADSELPKYTGDSGPYFPSLTAMWMFIWFTKNSIGDVSNYSFKSLF